MSKSVMFTRFFRYLKSVLASVFVLYLSFAPPGDFRKLPAIHLPHADKFVHLAMFFMLAFVLCCDFFKAHRNVRNPKLFWVVCVLYPVVLGAVIEFAQEAWFYPRSAEWLDWLADIVGVVVAVAAFLFLKMKGVLV